MDNNGINRKKQFDHDKWRANIITVIFFLFRCVLLLFTDLASTTLCDSRVLARVHFLKTIASFEQFTLFFFGQNSNSENDGQKRTA